MTYDYPTSNDDKGTPSARYSRRTEVNRIWLRVCLHHTRKHHVVQEEEVKRMRISEKGWRVGRNPSLSLVISFGSIFLFCSSFIFSFPYPNFDFSRSWGLLAITCSILFINLFILSLFGDEETICLHNKMLAIEKLTSRLQAECFSWRNAF